MAIHHWPASEQPREKLIKSGAKSLSDAELLAIFLRTGVTGCSAVEMARNLLIHYGSLQALFNADEATFCQAKGLGQVKYVQLQAVLEMARRYFWEDLQAKPALNSAEQARDYIFMQMRDLEREVFSCIFLDSQHQIIAYKEVFQGTINQAPVFPRELVKQALGHNAAAIILAHNHPSGVHEPSSSDKEITEHIHDAMALLDIRVLDHFIVGHRGVYSFSEHGLL